MGTLLNFTRKELAYLESQKRKGDLSLRKYNRINILLLLSGFV